MPPNPSFLNFGFSTRAPRKRGRVGGNSKLKTENSKLAREGVRESPIPHSSFLIPNSSFLIPLS
jgi:hypothetical protein